MPSRQTITAEQKVALRAQRKIYPNQSNLELRKWFEATFTRRIAPSSVSEILSSRFDSLDNHPPHLKQNRRRVQAWPDLENALFAWVKQAEKRIIVSGEVIREKARFFWQNIALYEGKEMPTFSEGWLSRFKVRAGIKERVLHGEDASVNDIESKQQMVIVRQALSAYSSDNIYNCDETGLYWKRIPDRSLTTCCLPGRKKEKARITVHFCCNSSGSERLPPWVIGTTKTPRCFRNSGINIRNLNIIWKHNKKAWMTGEIFEEWLRWFDERMTGRKVALLMDNFSAHEVAVEMIQSSAYPLQNVFVIWLPPNSTSRFQPLDQGIIHTWKGYWKRQWIQYMLQQYDAGKDPVTTMNVLKAVRWTIHAWELDLKLSTLERCFHKALKDMPATSEGIDMPATSEGIDIEPSRDIEIGLHRMQEESYIRDIMDVQQFIDPVDENIENSFEELDAQILAKFGPDIEDDSDEEVEILPRITHIEALDALNRLRLYEEQQDEGLISLLQALALGESNIRKRQIEARSQMDIRSYFN
jgi:hypothetical protein